MASVFQGERGAQIEQLHTKILKGIQEIIDEGKAAEIFEPSIPTE